LIAGRVALRSSSCHNSYIELIRIGDAASVPYLIRALAWEGRYEPPPGALMGMICTRTHVPDALSGIANDYAGANTEDWWLWYDAHRQESEEQWVRDGFLRIGLSVDLPLDDGESRRPAGTVRQFAPRRARALSAQR
jgi:hypothetical protein